MDEPVPTSGLLHTDVLIVSANLPAQSLPDLRAVCAITLAELHAGPQAARGDTIEEVRRRQVLQHVERTFRDPLPFGVDAARVYGSVSLLTMAADREPQTSEADLMIASITIADRLPLYTRNPKDFEPLRSLLDVREV